MFKHTNNVSFPAMFYELSLIEVRMTFDLENSRFYSAFRKDIIHLFAVEI